MAKQLNVNLAFTADTSQAKAQVQDLQNQLTKLINQPAMTKGFSNVFTDEISAATKSAAELKVHLQNATNVKTGTLDFSKLSQSIKASGKDLNDYAQSLRKMGPEGQKAFMALASSVTQAEVPIRRSNAMLQEFATTLKNTARWQFSSSILHGFMGTLSSAYGYAQRLNESLNNIRIVTNFSSSEMATFAEQANRAAKALSTTTTEYTNASLIYYQQGLTGKEVQERTDITVKMANVTGQSAQVVSDQLTAIWNNFNKSGEESYERYADILTALGAATASSTDEIAGGLEKFASIADMIGLSYEYAASALATITATTRQSEDVVGTALKTIFARIQGLSLGETLDDGTDLNKYSQALEKVGISIFDQAGELKNMDAIVEEIGNKWETLNKDQQIALAQTVAGVRQYNQLVSWFDNWDYFEQNLEVAMNSTGELSKQAAIYEESWEAASNRVRAAMEGVFQQLLQDDFFIGMLNTIEKVVSAVDGLVSAMGGMGGTLATIGAISTKVLSKEMAAGLKNMAYNIKMSTKTGREQAQKEKSDFIKKQADQMYDADIGTEAGRVGKSVYESQLKAQQAMLDNASKISQEEQNKLNIMMDQQRVMGDMAIKAAEEDDAAKDKLEDSTLNLRSKMLNAGGRTEEQREAQNEAFSTLNNSVDGYIKVTQALEQIQAEGKATEQTLNQLKKGFSELTTGTEIAEDQLRALEDALDSKDLKQAAQNIAVEARSNLDAAKDNVTDNYRGKDVREGVDSFVEDKIRQAETKAAREARESGVKKTSEELEKEINKINNFDVKTTWADRIVAGAEMASSAIASLEMLGSAIDALSDPNLTGWEKFTAVISSVAMAVPMAAMAISSAKTAFSGLSIAVLADTAAQGADAAATFLHAKAKEKLANDARKAEQAIEEQIEELHQDMYAQEMAAGKTDGNKGEIIPEKNNKNHAAVSGLKKSLNDVKTAAIEAWEAYGNTISKFMRIGGAVAIAVAAIGAAIAIYNQAETAARKAGEAFEAANTAFSKAQGDYNSFESSVSTYENAIAGMATLVSGTEEYRLSVIEANEAALNLISTIEGLEYHTDENGLIVIDEESLKNAKETQLQILEAAQASKKIAALNKDTADLNVQKQEFKREKMVTYGDYSGADSAAYSIAGGGIGAAAGIIGTGIIGGEVLGQAIGAALGTAIGGPAGTAIGIALGAAIGASVGTVIGDVMGTATAREEKAIQALVKAYDKDGNAAFANIDQILKDAGVWSEDLSNSLQANIGATQELIVALHANAEAVRAANEERVKNYMGDDIETSGLTDKGKEHLTGMATDEFEKVKQEKYDTTYASWVNRGGKTDAQIQEMYAEAMGYASSKNRFGNEATYYDEQGNEIATIPDEVARMYLAEQAALEAVRGNLEESIQGIDAVTEIGDSIGEGIGDVLSGIYEGSDRDLGGLTRGELNSLNVGEYDRKSNTFTIDGNVIDAEMAQDLGYRSVKAYYNAIQKNISQAQSDFDSIGENLSDHVKNSLKTMLQFKDEDSDKSLGDNLTLNSQKSLGNMLEQTYAQSGEKGIAYIRNFVQRLDDEAANAFLEASKNVDFSDWTAVESLKSQLKAMEDLPIPDDIIDAVIGRLADLNNAIYSIDVEAFRQKIAEVQAILDSLQMGGTISEEDYNTLMKETDGAVESYFKKMNDGTYKLVGSADALADAINGISKDKLAKIKHELGKEYTNNENKIQGYAQAQGDLTDKEMRTRADRLDNTDEVAQAQMDAALATGVVDQSQIDAWNEKIAKGEDLKRVYREIAEAARDAKAAEQEAAQGNEEIAPELESAETGLALTATDSDELANMGLGHEAEIVGLQNLGSQYESCAAALDALIAAQEAYNAAKDNSKTTSTELAEIENNLKQAEEDLKDSVVAAELGMSEDAFEDYADSIAEGNEALEENEKLAKKVAKSQLEFEKGLKSAKKVLNDNEKALQKSRKGTSEYSQACGDLADALNETFGEGVFDAELVSDNLDTVKKALAGNVDAIEELIDIAGQEVLIDIGVDVESGAGQVINDWIGSQEFNDIEVGTSLDTAGMTDAFNQLIMDGTTTAAELSKALSAVGWEPKISYKQVPIDEFAQGNHDMTQTVEVFIPDEGGGHTETMTLQSAVEMHGGSGATVNVPFIDGGETVKGASPAAAGRSLGGGSGGGGGGGGGGGSSKPAKRIERRQRKENVPRYNELTNALEELTDVISDTETMMDRLYGAKRLEAMDELSEKLQDEIDLHKAKLDLLNKEYYAEDRQHLQDTFTLGAKDIKTDNPELYKAYKSEWDAIFAMQMEFDEESQEWVNRTEMHDMMHDLYNKVYDSWSHEGKTEEQQKEFEEKFLTPLTEFIDAMIGAGDDYNAIIDERREIENAIQEAYNRWQDNNYDKLHYKLEIKVEINDLEMKMIDYYLNKFSDDFYSMSEALGYLLNKIPLLKENLSFYGSPDGYKTTGGGGSGAAMNFVDSIKQAYLAGNISHADYVDGLKEAYEAILDNLDALNELDKQMMHYYEDTLAAARDEFDRYNDSLQNLTSTLEHYANIVKMLNGEEDYDSLEIIAKGQVQTSKNEMNAAIAYYEMLQREKADLQRTMAASGAGPEGMKGFEQELQAIDEQLNAAYQDVLSTTSTFVENSMAVYQLATQKAAKAMERAMTNGMGFEQLGNSLNRLSSHAEVYLTKTNQIYEMQTLINKATTESDKITNKAAQARLKAFMDETEALKEKNKLSNLELDIQKAKYDLLLAEIALEEAQNAKSTVRLKRDSEGNFGYVYTADQEKVNDAEQELLDTKNRLYNIGLDGANQYGQMLLQIRQEYADALAQLEEDHANKKFATEEEYQQARERVISEYTQLIEAYSEQYKIATGVDAAIVQEAWVGAYNEMIETGGTWSAETTAYYNACNSAWTEYQNSVRKDAPHVEKSLEDIQKATDEVTDASDELANEIIRDVIPSIEDELQAVRAQTAEYWAQRDALLALIAAYEAYAQQLLTDIKTEAFVGNVSDYSLAMAQHLANNGNITDDEYIALQNARLNKINSDPELKAKYLDGVNRFNKLMEMYDAKDPAAMDYVDSVLEGEEGIYFDDEEIKKIVGMATGGFTGVWGPDGRLAMLHEKELVLNASDTANFLQALDVMREIVKSIDLENLRQQYSHIINDVPILKQFGGETLEQNVHIEASFPAVRDRNEIEEAFNNLINTASQFANRKRI